MALDSATLSKAFDDANVDVESDAIAELVLVGKEHGLNATSLAENWEAFMMTIKSKKNAPKTAVMEQFRSYVKKNTKPEVVFGGYGDGYRFTNTLELADDDGSTPIFTRTPGPAVTARQSVGARAEVSLSSPEPATVGPVAIELLTQVRKNAGCLERDAPNEPLAVSFRCGRRRFLLRPAPHFWLPAASNSCWGHPVLEEAGEARQQRGAERPPRGPRARGR